MSLLSSPVQVKQTGKSPRIHRQTREQRGGNAEHQHCETLKGEGKECYTGDVEHVLRLEFVLCPERFVKLDVRSWKVH